MRSLRITVAAVLSLLPGAVSALTLDPSPDAQGRSVVNGVFGQYIAQRVGVQVETALVDIEGDNVAEVVVRFVHSDSCRANLRQCRTVVLRHGDDKNWGIVLDRPADIIDVPKPERSWKFVEIKVDGKAWIWNGKAYAPAPGSLGQKVAFSPVPKETAKALAAAFGPGAVLLADSPDTGVSYEYARAQVADQGEFLLVRMKGDVACGDVTGCPVRLLQKDGASWRTILDGSSIGDVEVSQVVRGGWKDVVLGTRNGFAVMGWNGKSYGLADTVEATGRLKGRD